MGHFLAALFGKLIADEVKAWVPWCIERLTKVAVTILPTERQERYREEWQSHLREVPGEWAKLCVSAGFIWAARRMSIRPRSTLAEVSGLALFLILWPVVRFFTFLVGRLTGHPCSVLPTVRLPNVVGAAQVCLCRSHKSLVDYLGSSLRQNLDRNRWRYCYWDWRHRWSDDLADFLQAKGLLQYPVVLDVALGKVTIREVLSRKPDSYEP